VCGAVVRGGTLVVCPASLLQQWAGETGKHCRPHAVSVLQHHGAARAQQPHRLASADLVLTTYNILQRDSEKVFSTFTCSPMHLPKQTKIINSSTQRYYYSDIKDHQQLNKFLLNNFTPII
jgi:SNF2 family DNA or RNA helicase